MRGKWIFNLGKRILEKKVSPIEGIRFVFSRFVPKPTAIRIRGILFKHVDHTLWSLIADIFFNQEYTPYGFEIKPNDVVVDIGGHRGAFTAFARMHTQNAILVYEPEPKNFSHLKDLVERHHWMNVEIKNMAIGESEGELALFIGKTGSRNTILGKDVVTSEELDESVVVQSTTLDKALEALPAVDFLKMDCEGAEFSILLNCNGQTFDKIKKISLEYHALAGSQELKQLNELLERHYSEVTVKHLSGFPLGYLYAK